jgi:hypothetical protein
MAHSQVGYKGSRATVGSVQQILSKKGTSQ